MLGISTIIVLWLLSLVMGESAWVRFTKGSANLVHKSVNQNLEVNPMRRRDPCSSILTICMGNRQTTVKKKKKKCEKLRTAIEKMWEAEDYYREHVSIQINRFNLICLVCNDRAAPNILFWGPRLGSPTIGSSSSLPPIRPAYQCSPVPLISANQCHLFSFFFFQQNSYIESWGSM